MLEKSETMEFSETIVVFDLKLATDDRSDKKFLLTSKLCLLGGGGGGSEAVCPLHRGSMHVLRAIFCNHLIFYIGLWHA